MKYIALLIFSILASSAISSVVTVNLCRVSAKVVEVKPFENGGEILKIKILKKSEQGSLDEKCSFIQEGHSYTALINKKYQGKWLRVPALVPDKLKLSAVFNAHLIHQKENKKISWSLLQNDLSLPEGTSFFTSSRGIAKR